MRGKAIKDQKRKEAKERQKAHNKLTVQQKITKLDKKFGKGKGARKERIKLQKQIEKEKTNDTRENTKKTGGKK